MNELIKKLEDMIENVAIMEHVGDYNMAKAYEEQCYFIIEKINKLEEMK